MTEKHSKKDTSVQCQVQTLTFIARVWQQSVQETLLASNLHCVPYTVFFFSVRQVAEE